jgi:hypothetical protein
MNSNEQVLNWKVVDIIEIYNFDFGCFTIRGSLKILKFENVRNPNIIFIG